MFGYIIKHRRSKGISSFFQFLAAPTSGGLAWLGISGRCNRLRLSANKANSPTYGRIHASRWRSPVPCLESNGASRAEEDHRSPLGTRVTPFDSLGLFPRHWHGTV